MQPRMVYAIRDPNSTSLTIEPPLPLDHVPKAHQVNWDTIIRDMHDVVQSPHGTARSIDHNLTYTIAGKTGTAQVFGIKQDEEYVAEDVAKKLRDHALFIGFAPVDKPRIAVAVVVENGGGGGSVAAPIARQVMDYYLLQSPEGRLGNDETAGKRAAAR